MAQRLDIFRKARPAVPATGIEEFVADARVRSDPLPNHIDVGADTLAEVGDVVHKADAGSEHGIGRVLGHLGRRYVHKQNWKTVE